MRYLRSSNKLVVYYLRTQKIELKSSLALAYMLYLYKLYWLYILKENLVNFSELGPPEGSKVCCCQHQKRVSVLVDF